MRTLQFTESIVEDATLAWLSGLGYAVFHGPDIAAGAGTSRTNCDGAGVPDPLRIVFQQLRATLTKGSLD